MSEMISVPVEQAGFNVLPPNFRNWLDFYDRLPPEQRDEPLLKCQVRDGDKIAEYRIQRDFYLARIAEALLPSRYTKLDLTVLEQVLHGARHTDSLIPHPSDFIEQLWRVAIK